MNLSNLDAPRPERREVVKLVTSSWNDNRGLHIRRDLIPMKRKSIGHSCLEEDCSMIGPDEVWPRIINLNECKDGIYQVVTGNERRDWESGDVEDYDYKLIPFKEAPSPSEFIDSKEGRQAILNVILQTQ